MNRPSDCQNKFTTLHIVQYIPFRIVSTLYGCSNFIAKAIALWYFFCCIKLDNSCSLKVTFRILSTYSLNIVTFISLKVWSFWEWYTPHFSIKNVAQNINNWCYLKMKVTANYETLTEMKVIFLLQNHLFLFLF